MLGGGKLGLSSVPDLTRRAVGAFAPSISGAPRTATDAVPAAGSDPPDRSSHASRFRRPSRYSDYRVLRWATIVVPVVFVVTVDYLVHSVFGFLPGGLILIVLFTVAAVAIYLFSTWVFGRIEAAEQRVWRSQRDLWLLNSISGAASEPLAPDALLNSGLHGVMDSFDADAGLVCVAEPNRGVDLRVAGTEMGDLLRRVIVHAVRDGSLGDAPVVLGTRAGGDSSEQHAGVRSAVKAAGFAAAVGVPLRPDSDSRGAVFVFHRQPRTYEVPQVRFLVTLAAQLAVAVDKARVRRLAADLAVLEERERIAREMHDGLAQVLGYINAKTSAISRLLTDGNVATAQAEVQALRAAARDLSKDVRESILGLRQASQGSGDFVTRVRDCASDFTAASGIPVTFDWGDPSLQSAVSESVEVQAMRIVQEALTNVRRHAQAKRVVIAGGLEGSFLTLRIEDDGRGFQLGNLTDGAHHFGLKTMEERARAVGGSVQVESQVGSGCRVHIALPALEV